MARRRHPALILFLVVWQGKQEAELGLPISPVCNEFSTDVPKSQVGFIKMLCQPLFAGLAHIDPSGRIEAVSKLEETEGKKIFLIHFLFI